MANKKDKPQGYMVLDIMESRDGSQRWLPGSTIELTDAQALPYIERGGVIEPLPGTTPPTPAPPLTQVVRPGESAALKDEPDAPAPATEDK